MDALSVELPLDRHLILNECIDQVLPCVVGELDRLDRVDDLPAESAGSVQMAAGGRGSQAWRERAAGTMGATDQEQVSPMRERHDPDLDLDQPERREKAEGTDRDDAAGAATAGAATAGAAGQAAGVAAASLGGPALPTSGEQDDDEDERLR